MKTRIYAEAMYGSVMWQVVRENLVNGEHSIVAQNLSQTVARAIAGRMQQAVDEVILKESLE